MKRAIGSNARASDKRSKKDCVCGGHSVKSRQKRTWKEPARKGRRRTGEPA